MNLLKAETIPKIHKAAVAADLVSSHDKLLGGLPPSYVDTLPDGGRPDARLLGTLYKLNEVPQLLDGTVPLAVWLRNAIALSGHRSEGDVFQRALDELSQFVAARPQLGSGKKGGDERSRHAGVESNDDNAHTHLTAPLNRPARICISYAPTDSKYRARLEHHLASLRRAGLVVLSHDRAIEPGQDVDKAVDLQLATADIVLLLVSPDFMASDACIDRQMETALERHRSGVARVIPVVVRPTEYSTMPFARLQALPIGAKPVSTWRKPDDAWLAVVKGIRGVVKTLGAKPAPA